MNRAAEQHEGVLGELTGHEGEAAADRLRTRRDASSVLLRAVEEAERLVISDLSRAMGATLRLVALADAVGAPLPRIRARRVRGQALSYSNRFAEALAVLEEGAAIADTTGEALEAAKARLTSVHSLARLGRFTEAVAAGEAARTAFLAAGETAFAAMTDANLGVTRRMMDDPRGALVHLDRAKRALADQPIAAAQVDSNRAEAMLDLNDFAGAEAAFRSALDAFERAGARHAAAIVEGNLADLMSRQGRLNGALALFEQARRRLGGTDAPGDVARLEAERAETLAAVGLHAEAATVLQSVIGALREHRMPWEAARAQVALGRALMRLGRAPEAAEVLAAAAAGFLALGHTTGAARVDLLRADLLARDRRLQAAADLAGRALRVLADRPAEVISASLQLAVISALRGDLAQAELEAADALRGAEAMDLAPLTADALHLVARLRRAGGHVSSAARDLHRAIDELERVRGALQADRLRAAFLGDRAAMYEECFAADLDAGGAEDAAGGGSEGIAAAFAVAERAKSRSLLDAVCADADPKPAQGRSARAASESREGELLGELAAARAELNGLYARLDRALVSRQPLPEPASWRRQMQDCEGRIDEVQTRLAAGEHFRGVFVPTIDLRTAQSMLTPQTAMIQYFAESGWVSAIVVRSDGAAAVRRMAHLTQVARVLERLGLQVGRAVARAAIPGVRAASRTGAVRELRQLHAAIFAPLHHGLRDVRRLLVLPYGVLHGVPFHALHDGDRHVLEWCEVVQAPSASVVARLRGRGSGAGPVGGGGSGGADRRGGAAPCVVVGLGDAAAEAEARAIAGALKGRPVVLLVGEDATRARVLDASAGARVLHIASHARFSRGAPMASGIRLADGWLTVRDVVGTGLSGAAVTLSACDTGRSVVEAGDEALSLARGFLAAGASSVVMSLWPVHGDLTTGMMTLAYQLWRAGSETESGGLAGPLRRAQRELMCRSPHPAAWAPFAVIGAAS